MSEIAKSYQLDFENLKQGTLQPTEQVIWAGNFTQFKNGDYRFGYLVLTPQRLIRISFEAEVSFGCLSCLVLLITLGYGAIFLGPDKPKRSYYEVEYRENRSHRHYGIAVAVPATPLTPHELSSRKVEDFFLHNITSLQRADERIRGTDHDLVEFEIRFLSDDLIRVVLFSKQEAAEMYTYLQKHAQSRADQASIDYDLADQLQRLVQLHEAGILTDEEFDAAKRRLISY